MTGGVNNFWGIAISAISALGAIYAIIQSRQKVKAEADSLVADAASQLVETVMTQLDYLDEEVKKLRATIVEYRAQVEEASRTEERLTSEIRSLRRKVRMLMDFILDQGMEPPSLDG